MVDTFGSFCWFAKEGPEDVQQVGLDDGIADSKGRDGFLEIGGDDHEEVDDVLVGASMPVCLL